MVADMHISLDDASFERIAGLLYRESGIVLSENKKHMVVSRLSKRIRELKLDGFPAYCDHLHSNGGGAESKRLISMMTTNVTRFFREGHHFDALRDSILPRLAVGPRGGGAIRMWSAACSTGEEPYSIAMTVADSLADFERHDIRILGTDIDPVAVAKARGGTYFEPADAGIPGPMVSKYFEKAGDGNGAYRVRPRVKGLVEWMELNLLAPWPRLGTFDVIFCRNVAIYFDAETQAKLWQRLTGVLKPGGTLFIGHSERVAAAGDLGLTYAGPTQYRKSAN